MQLPRKTGWLVPALFLAAAAVLPARAAEPDKFVPSESEGIAVLNVQQILNSTLVKKYGLEELKTQIKNNKDAKKFMEASGIDPFKDIHSVIVSFAQLGKSAEPNYQVVIHGNFDLEKVNAALAEEAKTHSDELKIETQDGHKVFQFTNKKGGGPGTTYGAFANKETMVLAPSTKQVLTAVKGSAGKLGAELLTALEKLTGKESFYAAILVTDEMKNGMKGNPQLKDLAPKLQFVTATIDLTADLKINLTVQTTDAQAASKVKMTLSQFVPLIGLMAAGQQEKLGPTINSLVKQIEIKKNDKNAVSVSLNVTEEMMKEMHEAGGGTEKKPAKPQ